MESGGGGELGLVVDVDGGGSGGGQRRAVLLVIHTECGCLVTGSL